MKRPPEKRLTDRVDTLEMRARLCKLVGNHRAELYFRSLGRFMSCQLGKEEFDRTCLALLGRNNIHLHNALIKSIYSNACTAAAPPPPALTTTTRNSQTTTTNGTLQNNAGGVVVAASRMSRRRSTTRPVTTNTTTRFAADNKPNPLGKSPLGPPGEFVSTTGSSKRPREVVILVENDDDEVDEARGRRRGSTPAPLCVQSHQSRTDAPLLGVVAATVHQNPQPQPSSTTPPSCYNDGELPDSQALSRLLEDRLKDYGGRLTAPGESADILNAGLNAYITQMLETCLGVAKARGDKASCRRMRPPPPNCGSAAAAAVNSGGHQHHAGSPVAPEAAGCRRSYQASLPDVRAAAVQSNGRLVGFTLQHEKITSHLRNR